jgi:cytochrome b561
MKRPLSPGTKSPASEDVRMQLHNSVERYGAIPKTLHWVTVGLVIVAWVLGTWGEELPRGAARSAGLSIHASAGLGILGLLLIRVVWRAFDPPPPPERTPWGSRLEAVGKLTQIALYGLLAATPIVGILLQFARGIALPVFGIVEIASPWAPDRALAGSLNEIHEVLSNLLVILAAFHAAAAFVHHWVWRDRTLERMLPGIAR